MTSSSRAPSRQGTRQGAVVPSKPTLLCNLCCKPLATTCFLCACDCIFCEDCTYSHFERSSECPACGTVLNENDFTELVVADATSTTNEATKTTLQALFVKKTSSSSLPFSDLCFSLIRQIDAVKISTKFLLKQFLMNASTNGRQSGQAARLCEALKHEVTQLKQLSSTQRLEYQQVTADMKNKLQAREAVIVELQRKIQSMENGGHAGNVVPRLSSGSAPPSRMGMTRPNSVDHSRMGHNQPGHEPPLKGFMMQKEAKERAQQQQLQAHRAPSVLGRSSQNQGVKRNRSYGTESVPPSRGHQTNVTPIQMGTRPYSSNSGSGSVPGTPRIRDLSSSSGYRFTSGSNGHWQQGSQHINKRRRGTPSSSGGEAMPSVHRGMSPSTAFTLNNGQHSQRGPTQYFNRG